MKTFKQIADLYASAKNPEWVRLSVRSKEIYLRGLIHIARFNDMDIKKITRPDIIKYRDDMYDYPGKCRVGLTAMSNVFRYAYDRGMCDGNPAANVRGLPKKKPIDAWTKIEIDKFLATAPIRLKQAVMLALYTGQRRSDLVRMRWQDYNGDTIMVRQQKTTKELEIPVHKRLKEVLDVMPRDKSRPGFIILNVYKEKWSADGLRKAIKDHLDKIGIKDRSVHGLRKSAAVFLAEAGCTPHQIMAITGHASFMQVAHYTIAASQKKLARSAMEQWK